MNDGGATSSALGNILGGIAQQVGPEAAAKAALLYQQTQGADIANERNYTQEVLDANAARQSGGILATGGADAQPPGSVASTTARLAQPPITGPGPGGRYPLVDTTGMTPNQTYMAGRLFTGMSPSDLTTAINLGRNETLGPGQDFTTQNEIAKAKAVPYDVTTGVEHHIPGGAPGGETVVTSQQDPATVEAERQQRGLDVSDAENRSKLGENAARSAQEATRLRDIYNTLVAPGAADDMMATWSDEALRYVSQATGFPLTKASPRLDAINAIKSRMAALAGNAVQTIQAGAPVRGILENANKTLADPEANAEQFNSAVDQMLRGYKSQLDAKGPADVFRASHFTKADADAYRAALAAQQAREAEEFKTEKPPAASPKVDPQRELVYAREALNQGRKREDIIARAKQRGVDLEALGF